MRDATRFSTNCGFRARLETETASLIYMGRRIRFVPAGSLVEVTCRTLQGRLFLQPTRAIADLCRGILARAARLHPLDVHTFAFLGNHYHQLLTVPNARRLSEFMNYLNSNLAREIGRAVGWREKFWGRRYQAIVVAADEAAQVGRLLYILQQGCKENLVRRPTDWPGATSVEALLTGAEVRGWWFDRSMEYEARRRKTFHGLPDSAREEVLRLAPLPCWRGLTVEARRARILELVRLVEEESRRRIEDTGRQPADVDFLLRQDPHEPAARSKRSAAPLVHAATSADREAMMASYFEFVSAYRRASEQLRLGGLGSEFLEAFPEGCFPPPGPFVARSPLG